MSTLHTSGPWVHRVMTMPRKVWAALGRSEIQIVAKNGNVIAAVWCAEDRPGEKEANAVLIAACTDMLEALGKWVAYDNLDEADFSEAGPMLLYAEAIEATRAAIIKATAAP